MKDTNPIEDLQEIRKMMEDSSKFLSLSGLSGVFAGLVALGGAFTAHMLISNFMKLHMHYVFAGRFDEAAASLNTNLWLVAIGTLVLALGGGIVITGLKAKKNGQKLYSKVALRLLRSMMVPLFFGGVFIIGLIYHQIYLLIPPAMLIFYGMALLNASKYVHVDIKYLALSEMALGCILMFDITHGLIYWAIGFGGLHIIYGAMMWYKYDRKKQ